MATDSLDAIFDRLARAQEHLEEIKMQLLGYYNSDPCQMSGEFHPDENGGSGAVDWAPTFVVIDVRLNTIIGEFVHDTRSSLDHLAWQLVEHNGGDPTGDTCFPIMKVGQTPNKKGERPPPYVAGGVSEAALALIEDAQPYKWGAAYVNHPLWLLHQLWNIDKHRYVIAKGGRTELTFRGSTTPRFKFTARLDSTTEYGAKYLLAPDDPAVNVDAYATIEVGIHEPDYGIETPLLKTLEQMLQTVVGIVNTAKDRCF